MTAPRNAKIWWQSSELASTKASKDLQFHVVRLGRALTLFTHLVHVETVVGIGVRRDSGDVDVNFDGSVDLKVERLAIVGFWTCTAHYVLKTRFKLAYVLAELYSTCNCGLSAY